VAATDADGRTPLMMAAMQGWTGAIRELLAGKPAVNARDNAGRTAMDYADPGDREMIDLLRRAGSTSPAGRSGRTVCDAERALDKLWYETSEEQRARANRRTRLRDTTSARPPVVSVSLQYPNFGKPVSG
jgi:ankyrin repeat protein